jgi:hypothetical protein
VLWVVVLLLPDRVVPSDDQANSAGLANGFQSKFAVMVLTITCRCFGVLRQRWQNLAVCAVRRRGRTGLIWPVGGVILVEDFGRA